MLWEDIIGVFCGNTSLKLVLRRVRQNCGSIIKMDHSEIGCGNVLVESRASGQNSF